MSLPLYSRVSQPLKSTIKNIWVNHCMRNVIGGLNSLFLVLISFCFLTQTASNLSAQQPSSGSEKQKITMTAREILGKIDEAMDFKIPFIQSKLSQVSPNGTVRIFNVSIYHKGKHYIYELGSSGKGTVEKILFRDGGENIWVFNAQSQTLFHKQGIDKFRSIQQTDFYYFDLSGASYRANYSARIVGRENYKGRNCIKMELFPYYRSPVYGMLTIWVDEKRYLPLRVDFHDVDMVRIKTLSLVKVRENPNGTKVIPERMDMLHISNGTMTTLEHYYYDPKKEISNRHFLHQELR